ncbi:hypothetical protein GCM10009754_61210 [Amycolatopsis minnesotensis]|uniref:Uncharacterized protein n=1 Tax=Amycolatopsis minnesotensis TaxID=337894 RepID=A0ABN2RYC5_9PSEU
MVVTVVLASGVGVVEAGDAERGEAVDPGGGGALSMAVEVVSYVLVGQSGGAGPEAKILG